MKKEKDNNTIDDEYAELLSNNIMLLYKLAAKYKPMFFIEEEYYDFLGECVEDYVVAMKSFDKSLGYKPSAYMTKIVYNCYRTYVRKKNMKKNVEYCYSIDKENVDEMKGDSINDWNEVISYNKISSPELMFLYDEVMVSVDKLKHKDWLLKYADGYTLEEIAKADGVTRQWVAYTLAKYKEQLRKEYFEWFNDITE